MYTRPPMPGDGGSLWDELMGFIGEPDTTPTVDEPVAFRVGTVNPDDSYSPRDRDEVVEDHYQHELEQFRQQAEVRHAEMERQRQSRYTLRSLGFVFTDEGASVWEEMGGVVEYDQQPAPEVMFDPPPFNPAFIDQQFYPYGRVVLGLPDV